MSGKVVRILWVDDEIEVLRPHILYLQEKGYALTTCSNGNDAVDLVRDNSYDLVFLDEHMPGLSGMETLSLLRESDSTLPVIMVTRSEEERLMESAIGSSITDFLIKPVKPNQLLLAVKKVTEQRRLQSEKRTSSYLAAFNEIGGMLNYITGIEEWYALYRKLVYWQMELGGEAGSELTGILDSQITDANSAFAKFIERNYLRWMEGSSDAPLLSHQLVKSRVLPLLEEKRPIVFVVIDNLRYDQWRTLFPLLSDHYRIRSEELYTSVLPTATQYSRNAIFAGMMPAAVKKQWPELWIDDDEDEGKNLAEAEFLSRLLEREKRSVRHSYTKILSNSDARRLSDNYRSLLDNQLTALVVNSIDILSHARTDVNLMKELAPDEAAFCSVTRSWFSHSALYELLKNLAGTDALVVVTTDHGNIRVKNPVKVVGDRSTSTNLRYKLGRNLDYRKGDVFEIGNPPKAGLPAINISSKYIFATGSDFLVYPNNYNHFAALYRDSFQHGGISMQEMLCPFIVMEPAG